MTKQIILARGQICLVDDDDYDRLAHFRWRVKTTDGYVIRSLADKSTSYIHREIMHARPGQEVDHANGNKTDNRKQNLRFATRSENEQNGLLQRNSTTGFKGVSWHKAKHKYRAYITVNKRTIALGYFEDPDQAARAYDRAARSHFGPYARTNF